jgi:hypothetical protein
MRRNRYLTQTPQVFEIQIKSLLGDADSESFSAKQVRVLECLGQIVSDFGDIDFVLWAAQSAGILASQIAKQGSEFVSQRLAAWVSGRLWISVHVSPLKGRVYGSGHKFRLNELPFQEDSAIVCDSL